MSSWPSLIVVALVVTGARSSNVVRRPGLAGLRSSPWAGSTLTRSRSAADGRHGPGRLQEPGVVDAMAGQLDRDRLGPPLSDLLVAGPGPQRRAQVGLRPSEQAVADLAVGGQPDPVASTAEGPGHRGDHADPGRAAVDQEGL